MSYQLYQGQQIVPIVKSDATVYDPPLRALLVTAAGAIVVKDKNGGSGGTARTINVVNVPWTTPFEVLMVMATTAQANSDLWGIR